MVSVVGASTDIGALSLDRGTKSPFPTFLIFLSHSSELILTQRVIYSIKNPVCFSTLATFDIPPRGKFSERL